MLNNDSINTTLMQILGWGFIVLAIFVVIKGRKGKVSESGSMVLIGLFALLCVAMGGLVGTDVGRNILAAILNVGPTE